MSHLINDTATLAIKALRGLAGKHSDRRARKREQSAALLAEADVHEWTRVELLSEADRLEALLSKASEVGLFARLGVAMELEGTPSLLWVAPNACELHDDGVCAHVFAAAPYSDFPETVVPGLADGDRLAALLAILAVVEVTP